MENAQPLTNYERWKSYTANLPSPDNYIKWGWYYTIACALQRRVWYPPSHEPIFPNMFVVYVGDPAVGKGGIIRAQNSILKHYTINDIKQAVEETLSDADKKMWSAVKDEEKKRIEGNIIGKSAAGDPGKAYLFADAPDATTYESLVQSMANSIRFVKYVERNGDGKDRMKVYGHSSIHFSLEELASLMRAKTESLINFLIQGYDCGDEYRYKTKTGGEDRITKVCVNFSAGTTPDFMSTTFDEKLVNQGFSSRTFFIYGRKNRKISFQRPELTELQKQHKEEILKHIAKLACIHGQVQVDDDTAKWLQEWIEDDFNNPHKRASRSAKLSHYYGRKNIHIMKAAMAKHFGESTDLFIPRRVFEEVIADFHEEEKTMAIALMVSSKNPLAKPTKKVLDHLSVVGECSLQELVVEFWGDVSKDEMEQIISFLEYSEQIVHFQKQNELTKLSTIYYKIKK